MKLGFETISKVYKSLFFFFFGYLVCEKLQDSITMEKQVQRKKVNLNYLLLFAFAQRQRVMRSLHLCFTTIELDKFFLQLFTGIFQFSFFLGMILFQFVEFGVELKWKKRLVNYSTKSEFYKV